MDDTTSLAGRFEEHRERLGAIAYRMLGSRAEADDAVQETWLRVGRAGAENVDNLGAWLTTILSRTCLNMLRSRNRRREDPLQTHLPDPVVSSDTTGQPEAEAVLADSVSMAMLVVLDTLPPAERLAFVLHDMFEVPFDEIAPLVDRSPQAARQLASRARRRVRDDRAPRPDPDLGRQREVVDAFFKAARGGEFEALVTLLHPDVELRADYGPGRAPAPSFLRGAEAVAGSATRFAIATAELHLAVVDGRAGAIVTVRGRPIAVMAFTVSDGRIARIDAISDPDRAARLAVGSVAAG
jgi:RNA polymerase sigma factor (sigma-70 family)